MKKHTTVKNSKNASFYILTCGQKHFGYSLGPGNFNKCQVGLAVCEPSDRHDDKRMQRCRVHVQHRRPLVEQRGTVDP